MATRRGLQRLPPWQGSVTDKVCATASGPSAGIANVPARCSRSHRAAGIYKWAVSAPGPAWAFRVEKTPPPSPPRTAGGSALLSMRTHSYPSPAGLWLPECSTLQPEQLFALPPPSLLFPPRLPCFPGKRSQRSGHTPQRLFARLPPHIQLSRPRRREQAFQRSNAQEHRLPNSAPPPTTFPPNLYRPSQD